MSKVRELLRKFKKGALIIAIAVGGGLVIIFSGGLTVDVPASIENIARLQKDEPAAFETLLKIYEIAEDTRDNAVTCDLGLAPNKIGPESDLQVLENLGYVKRIQREKWNAVVIPCGKTEKARVNVSAFLDFLEANEPKPPVIVSPTST